MSNSVDIMINGRQTVTPAVDQTSLGLQKLSQSLHGVEGGLKSFNSLMEIALGVHVGRFFFEKIHEGLAKLTEGFAEAKHAGMNFTESISEGIDKMLGLKTAAEYAKEFAKNIGEADAALRKLGEARIAASAGFGLGAQGATEFPGLRRAAPLDEVLQKVREQRLKTAVDMGPINTQVNQLEIMRAKVRSGERLSVADQEFLALNGITPWNIQARYSSAKNQLGGYQQRMTELDNLYQDTINTGKTATTNQGYQDFLGNRWAAVQRRVAQGIVDVSNAPGNALWAGIAPVLGMVASGANRQSVEEQLRIERMRLAEGQKSLDKKTEAVQRVGAENQRFLTQGPGNPMLSEAIKTNANLEAIKDKIKDLEKKLNDFQAVGVAAKL